VAAKVRGEENPSESESMGDDNEEVDEDEDKREIVWPTGGDLRQCSTDEMSLNGCQGWV
jgi:hypothetical protein